MKNSRASVMTLNKEKKELSELASHTMATRKFITGTNAPNAHNQKLDIHRCSICEDGQAGTTWGDNSDDSKLHICVNSMPEDLAQRTDVSWRSIGVSRHPAGHWPWTWELWLTECICPHLVLEEPPMFRNFYSWEHHISLHKGLCVRFQLDFFYIHVPVHSSKDSGSSMIGGHRDGSEQKHVPASKDTRTIH